MSLGEELADIKDGPEEEAMLDYFGECRQDAKDGPEDEHRRKSGRRKSGRALGNMTYSHEQRMRMGYYGAKWGIKALQKKFPGVKDSTARDMCNFVMALVVDGTLTLDLPIEKQAIPPKMRNGMPVLSSKPTKEMPSFAEAGPNQEPERNGTEQAPSPAVKHRSQVDGKQMPTADETIDHVFTSQHDGNSPSPALSFQDQVKIGFMAAKEGSCVTVKKCEVPDTTVRECRNVVIKLFESGKLSESTPLDEQKIPAQAPLECGAVCLRPLRRRRPPAFDGGLISPKEPKAARGSSPRSPSQTDHYTPPPPAMHGECRDRERSAPWNPPEAPPGAPVIPARLHRGARDISLGTDLAFRRWRNIRASLGFQNDGAFATHLLDVHDAFCSTSCRDGGRSEHQPGEEVSNHC